MRKLAGNAYISFEGELHDFRVMNIPGASSEETAVLKRNTTWPKQDFTVVPLEPSNLREILPAIGGAVPRRIFHIQIEKDGVLQFAAYDSFYPGSIVFGLALDQRFIESLVAQEIIKAA